MGTLLKEGFRERLQQNQLNEQDRLFIELIIFEFTLTELSEMIDIARTRNEKLSDDTFVRLEDGTIYRHTCGANVFKRILNWDEKDEYAYRCNGCKELIIGA